MDNEQNRYFPYGDYDHIDYIKSNYKRETLSNKGKNMANLVEEVKLYSVVGVPFDTLGQAKAFEVLIKFRQLIHPSSFTDDVMTDDNDMYHTDNFKETVYSLLNEAYGPKRYIPTEAFIERFKKGKLDFSKLNLTQLAVISNEEFSNLAQSS